MTKHPASTHPQGIIEKAVVLVILRLKQVSSILQSPHSSPNLSIPLSIIDPNLIIANHHVSVDACSLPKIALF